MLKVLYYPNPSLEKIFVALIFGNDDMPVHILKETNPSDLTHCHRQPFKSWIQFVEDRRILIMMMTLNCTCLMPV